MRSQGSSATGLRNGDTMAHLLQLGLGVVVCDVGRGEGQEVASSDPAAEPFVWIDSDEPSGF